MAALWVLVIVNTVLVAWLLRETVRLERLQDRGLMAPREVEEAGDIRTAPASPLASDQAVEILGRVLDNLTKPPENRTEMYRDRSEAPLDLELEKYLRMHLDPTDGDPMLSPSVPHTMVGGIAPGQGIPGIGDTAADDAARAEWEGSEAKQLGVGYEEWLGEQIGDPGKEPFPMISDGPAPWVSPRGFDG